MIIQLKGQQLPYVIEQKTTLKKMKLKPDISKKIRPWAADQSLRILEHAHLQATESDAPFDLQHYPSVCK